MLSAAKLAIILNIFVSQTSRSLKISFLKGYNRSISYVTMFFQHKKQCDEINETIFQTCKNPIFRQGVSKF